MKTIRSKYFSIRALNDIVGIVKVSTIFIGFILILLSGCRSSKETKVIPIESISWLNGRWSMGQEDRFEHFVINDGNYLERVIFQMEDGQPVISERARIFEKDGTLVMSTTIFDAEYNELSMYEMVEQKFQKLKFRNRDSDDPYYITFELDASGELSIRETSKSGKLIRKYVMSRQDLP